MIEIGNKRWRNLQEQVAWLTAMIGQATDVVKNVYGKVADAASLPDASTFSNGTTYAVGSASPYEYYVAINGSWLDIGTFPLEGPAGTDGQDGKSIFITSQATTSGTTQILISSVYNPDSLTVGAGDLILSEQGDVFAISGSTATVLYVVYRCNIKGPTGATGATGPAGADGADGAPGADGTDGTNILTSSATTTSSTTAIQTSTINVPTGYTAKAGDLIVSASGDVFISRGAASLPGYTDVTYCYNIKGSAGAAGADGATWYEGSDIVYESGGHEFDLDTSDAPGIKTGDLYLITTDYTSDGHDFTRGDIYSVHGISGTTADMQYVASILGPQGNTGATGADGADGAPGADGTDGATWYSGNDVIHTGGSGGAYVIPLSSLPDLKVGDLYLVTSTYTSDGETLNNGDVWAVYSIADPYAVMTFRTNLVPSDHEVVWINYNTASQYNVALQAYQAGKIVKVVYGQRVYDLENVDTGSGILTFICIVDNNTGATAYRVWLRSNDNWSNNTRPLLNNPIVQEGDLIYAANNYSATNLPRGTAGQVLTMNAGGTAPEWQTPSGGGGASIGGAGYTLTQINEGVSDGAFNILALGEYNGVYGWHNATMSNGQYTHVDGVDTSAYEFTITNCSIVVFTNFSSSDFNGITGDLYCNGTLINSAALISSNLHKVMHLEGDVEFSYQD